MLIPLKKTKLHEKISKQILTLILSGEWNAGDRLPAERELAEQLSVSRTAIREAIAQLEGKGVLMQCADGGTIVCDVTFGNLLGFVSETLSADGHLLSDLLGVRKLLEVEMARDAARHITPAAAERLRTYAEHFDRSIRDGKTGLTADNRFHSYIAELAQNSAMQLINEMCSDLLSDTRLATLRVPEQREQTVQDHYAICQAIAAGDAELAADRMREHLIRAHTVLCEYQEPDA